jgi:hypothetical protein
MLRFQENHCGAFYNIFIVNLAKLTTYILTPKTPRGVFSAMISNIPAGLEPTQRESTLSDTISDAQPISQTIHLNCILFPGYSMSSGVQLAM